MNEMTSVPVKRLFFSLLTTVKTTKPPLKSLMKKAFVNEEENQSYEKKNQ